MFGAVTLSFSDGVKTEPGDVFEIQASPFRWPLRNELRQPKPRAGGIGLLVMIEQFLAWSLGERRSCFSLVQVFSMDSG